MARALQTEECAVLATGEQRRRKLRQAVDALASRAEEGRGKLRKASGSEQPHRDPTISEWGNPSPGKG
jgi:hypothetical protein